MASTRSSVKAVFRPKPALNPEAKSFSPAQSASTTSKSSASSDIHTKTQRVGFFSLPFELRTNIYDLLLTNDNRVDSSLKGGWINAVGSTKVLMLNKQAYSEGMSMLDSASGYLRLSGKGRKIFRHPHANGKPGFFYSHAASSAIFVPDSLSELEFIKLHKATLYIDEDTSALDINEVCKAIYKSQSLQKICIRFQTSRASKAKEKEIVIHYPDAYTAHTFEKRVEPLLNLCIRKAITITAEAWTQFKNADFSVHRDGVYFIAKEYEDPLATYVNSCPAVIESNTYLAENPRDPVRIYHLTPECRTCYALFANTRELEKHLNRLPRHRISFVTKKYNPIHHFATSGGGRHACVVCGRSYNGENSLNEHVEKEGHQRDRLKQGIVPRFAQDNHWFKCTGPTTKLPW